MTIRIWISSSVSEIFAAELRSRPKSGQILHVFRPRNFFGVRPPKKNFRRGIIKFGLVLTIVQNFKPVGPRISEISRWIKKNKKTSCVKQKSFRKLSFSGGLKHKHICNSLTRQKTLELLGCDDHVHAMDKLGSAEVDTWENGGYSVCLRHLEK